MTTGVSFQGITSGVQTDALVSAIMAQASQPLVRLQNLQTANDKRTKALTLLQTDMTALSNSLQTLQYTGSGFDARSVTSSDINNTYATATASGAQTGTYDVLVTSVATKGRILPSVDGSGNSNLAVADPSGGGTSQVFSASNSSASFAIQGTDGVVKVITLDSGHNSLNGLQSAINASGAGVTASIVNTGSGAKPYQLVLTANNTGTGSTSGVVSLADVTSNDGATSGNLLGIAAGTVDSLTTPTSITGGTKSAAATNAVFSVNGLAMTRQTNSVNDAVDGLNLTLTKGGQTTPTTLTVAEDKSTVTTSMQDVISKYNTLLADYKTSSTATKDSDGNIVAASLSNDSTARAMMSQVRSVLTSIPVGMSPSAAYQSVGDLGITAGTDGTLTMNVAKFQDALGKNPDAAKAVFDFTGTTTNGVVNFSQGSAKTSAKTVAFNITSYDGNTGAWTGTLAADGAAAITVSGTKNGGITGAAGTSLEGLNLDVTGTGSGTMSLTKGVAQATQDLVGNLTAYKGSIWNTLQSITQNNTSLTNRISNEQSVLDTKQAQLQRQFAEMEAKVSQMRTASGSLSSS